MMKKLYLSATDKKLSGVFGGLGAYYDVDPTLLRIAFIVLVIMTGLFPGVFAYIIAAIVIPREPAAPERGGKGMDKDIIDM